MTLLRRFGFLWIAPIVLALMATSAQARSSSSRNNRDGRNTGPYRLIEGDTDSQKEREERRKKEEEQRKQQEEARKKQEEARKEAAAKKAEAAKEAAKPKPTAKPTVAAKPKPAAAGTKSGTGAKTDEAREAEASKLREQANKDFEKGDEEGLLAGAKALRQLVAEYDGTAAAQSAQQQLDLLLADAQLGPMILLAEAQEEFDAMRYRRARNKFQALAQRFPNSEQGATARARLAEIEQNDLLKKSVYTDEELEDARLWYLAGNIHLENGRKGEAASAYRRVVEEYPGCRYAVLAEERLPSTLGT
mgnify:FL=1